MFKLGDRVICSNELYVVTKTNVQQMEGLYRVTSEVTGKHIYSEEQYLRLDKRVDYENLLNDWAKAVLHEADKADVKLDSFLSNETYTHGYTKGFAEGLRWAVSKLNLLENRVKGSELK